MITAAVANGRCTMLQWASSNQWEISGNEYDAVV